MGDELIVQDGTTPARKSKSKAWPVVVIVVLLAIAGVGAYLGLQAMAKVSSAEAKLEDAVDLLGSVEDAVVAVDEVVQAEITSGLETTATAALDLVPQAKDDLAEAIDLLTQARVDLSEDDQILAQALQSAAEARLDMLDEAEPILSANIAAASALQPATEAWTLVADAENLSQSAVGEYNKHTTASVTQSTALSKQAAEKLTAARSAIETATASFPEAALQQFIDYIDARQKLLTSSMNIDATWLAGKVEEANNMLDAYSKEEAALIALGKALPASPTVAIADAYETLAAEPTERYYAAREKARMADEKVRELGTATTGE